MTIILGTKGHERRWWKGESVVAVPTPGKCVEPRFRAHRCCRLPNLPRFVQGLQRYVFFNPALAVMADLVHT